MIKAKIKKKKYHRNKKIITNYKQFYANKFYKQDKIYKFIDIYTLLRMNLQEIEKPEHTNNK